MRWGIIPEFDVDLSSLFAFAIWEDRMMVLSQSGLHVVETLEFNEGCTHEFTIILVCPHPDDEGLQLGEVCFDLFLGSAIR